MKTDERFYVYTCTEEKNYSIYKCVAGKKAARKLCKLLNKEYKQVLKADAFFYMSEEDLFKNNLT